MKLNTFIAAAALIGVSATSTLAHETFASRSLQQPGAIAAMEQEIGAGLAKTLEVARKNILEPGGRIILPYICPHVMEAMALFGTGAVGTGEAQRMIVSGLKQDMADEISTRMFGGVNLRAAGKISLAFELADGVKPDQMVEMIDFASGLIGQ